MRSPSSVILPLLGILAVSAIAQPTTLAVIDLDGIGVSQSEAVALSNRLRNELFRLADFDVVERGMMESILAEQDFQLTGCTSDECLVEVGRLVGARQMVGGSVSKVGDTFTVSARRIDVQTGKVIGVSDYDLQGALDQLLTRGMKEIAQQLAAVGSVAIPAQRETPVQVSDSGFDRYRWQWVLGGFGNTRTLNTFTAGFLIASIPLKWELAGAGFTLRPVTTFGIGGSNEENYDRETVDDGFYGVGVIEIQNPWNGPTSGVAPFIGSGVGFRANTYYDLADYDFDHPENNIADSEETVGAFVLTAGVQAWKMFMKWPIVIEMRWWANLNMYNTIFTLSIGTRFASRQ